jgi:hypothetical protein
MKNIILNSLVPAALTLNIEYVATTESLERFSECHKFEERRIL